jgi:predicted AAA+ superfamily ATPase
MARWFNTAGLCVPGKHYMVDPVPRLKEVEGLIAKEFYFTLHAPRQTGKTTFLHAINFEIGEAQCQINFQ